MSKPGRGSGGSKALAVGRSRTPVRRKALDMTAWLLYLTFLLTPLVLLIIFMAG